MANWRYEYLENDKSLSGDSGTYTVDLPKSGYLSSILLKYKDTRPASTTGALPRFHAITKIEIVDGSRIIQSFTGSQCQALAYYRGKRYGYNEREDVVATTAHEFFYIHFGEFNHDPKYMLDLAKLSSPQMKITWDGTQTSVWGFTYTAGSSISAIITVVATLADRPPAGFTGMFVQSSEIHSWDQAASSVEPVDIPADRPLYGLMIQAAYKMSTFTDDFSKVKFDINNGEWVPFEFEDYEIIQKQVEWFGEVHNNLKASIDATTVFDTGLGHVFSDSHTSLSGGDAWVLGAEAQSGGWLTPEVFSVNDSAEYTAPVPFKLRFGGVLPQHTAYFPMSKCTTDGLPYLDITRYRTVRLLMTSGSAVSTSCRPNVVAEYLERN